MRHVREFIESLGWPLWFLPVLATLGVRQDREYVLNRVAAVVVAAVISCVMVVVLPPWTALAAAPTAWLGGAFWTAFLSEKAPMSVAHDVLASNIAIIAVALIRLGVWWWLKI